MLSPPLEVREADLEQISQPVLDKIWVAQGVEDSQSLPGWEDGLAVIQHLCSRVQVVQNVPIRHGRDLRELFRQGERLPREVHIVLVGHFNALFKHVVLLPQTLYGGPIGGEIKVHEGDQLLGG